MTILSKLARRPTLAGFTAACIVVILLSLLGNLAYVNQQVHANNVRQSALAAQIASKLAFKERTEFESAIRVCSAMTYVVNAATGAKFYHKNPDSYGRRLEYGFNQLYVALNCKVVLAVEPH